MSLLLLGPGHCRFGFPSQPWKSANPANRGVFLVSAGFLTLAEFGALSPTHAPFGPLSFPGFSPGVPSLPLLPGLLVLASLECSGAPDFVLRGEVLCKLQLSLVTSFTPVAWDLFQCHCIGDLLLSRIFIIHLKYPDPSAWSSRPISSEVKL